MNPVFAKEAGKVVLMMGNEAIARGAIEAGVDFTASYPGSPSSEIQETLSQAAKVFGHHAEWSVNEKVAFEACCGASFAGLRAITAMKQNGLNVVSDVLNTVNLSGTKGGVVLVVADDPGGHSSTNEMDSRLHAKLAELPLLEPSTPEEAKEMVKYAFELSEKVKLPVLIRSVTRISHARGDVRLGEVPARNRKPAMGFLDRFVGHPIIHPLLHLRVSQVKAEFEKSPFNSYLGPEGAETVIAASGPSAVYAMEAVHSLGLDDQAGILKIGASWPMPEEFVVKHLSKAKNVIVYEEVEPFLEDNLKVVMAGAVMGGQPVPKFYCKRSGHIKGAKGPAIGEMTPDIVYDSLAAILGAKGRQRSPKFAAAEKKVLEWKLPVREWAFCAGCPHRASFWVIKNALKEDDREGVLIGDIGCYSMGVGKTGYNLSRTLQCMGAGIGFANGLGNLKDFNQPVVAIAGDSTFYHSCLPGLVNMKYNKSKMVFIVLDNSGTAMTGFQPHPGTGKNALGEPTDQVSMEKICAAVGIETRVVDPFELEEAIQALDDALESREPRVLIFRHKCALIEGRERKEDKPRVFIDQELCLGDECGCNRFCSRVFACPGLIWDESKKKAVIDDVVCTRCGICVSICPREAIRLESAPKKKAVRRKN